MSDRAQPNAQPVAGLSAKQVAGWLLDFDVWERVSERITSAHTYDLDDSSHRMDVVQIVCEALAQEVNG